MYICKATREILPLIMKIYASARAYMRENENHEQWKDNYPPREILEADIEQESLYLCLDSDTVAGVFVYFEGEDPTYRIIEEGAWQCPELPYGVMHRVAVAKHGCGVASFCFAWCFDQCKNLRIDTHRDNKPMRSALLKNGFTECGIIHLANGDPRIAYQKIDRKFKA